MSGMTLSCKVCMQILCTIVIIYLCADSYFK